MEYNIIVNIPKEKNYYSVKDVLQKGRTIIDKTLVIKPVAEFLNIDEDVIIYDILTNNKDIFTYNIGENTYHIIKSNLRQIENVTKNYIFELYCSVRRLLVDYFYPDEHNVDTLLNNSRNFQYGIFILLLIKLFIINSQLFDSLIALLVLGSLGFINFMDSKVYTKVFELNDIYEEIEPILASENISKEDFEKVIDKMETHLKTFDFNDFSWLSDSEKTLFKQITNETNVNQSLKQKLFKTITTNEGFAKHVKKHIQTMFRLTKFMKKILTSTPNSSQPPMLKQNLVVSATFKVAYYAYKALYTEEFDEEKYLNIEKMLDKYEEQYGKTTEDNKLDISLFRSFVGL